MKYKYEEIIELLKEYGEDYLSTDVIKKIEDICKYSDSMKKQLEESVTEEWIKRVQELRKILVYEDYAFENEAKRIRGNLPKEQLFPFVRCSYQDFMDVKNDKNSQKHIPNLKYYIERTIEKNVINPDINKGDTESEK